MTTYRLCPTDLHRHTLISKPEAQTRVTMEPDKSTISEVMENIEINLRNLSLKAGRMGKKEFKAFLVFAVLIFLIGVVGTVFIVKYLAPYIGGVMTGSVLLWIKNRLFQSINSKKPDG